jgi:hypothetical protein
MCQLGKNRLYGSFQVLCINGTIKIKNDVISLEGDRCFPNGGKLTVQVSEQVAFPWWSLE